MGSAKIEVTVLSRGRRVDGPMQRPVRLTPDGVAGIVYGGLVYPVHVGNVVDLEDASFDKYDCDSFVDADEPIPYATSGPAEPATPLFVERWHIERNKFGNYLVLDGSESVAETVVDRLEDAGFEIVRWDASHRPADDGYLYDWFIRFRCSGSAAEALDEIEDVLGRASGEIAAGSSRGLGMESQRKLDAARAENLALRHRLSEAQANEQATSARLASEQQTTGQLIEAGRKLQEHVHELRAKLADVEGTLIRERTARATSAPSAVREQLEHLERLRSSKADAEAQWYAAEERAEAVEAERDALRTENADLRVQADKARDRVDELSSLLEETASESAEAARRKAANTRSRTARHSIYEFLAKLFPRLSLDPDGVDDLMGFPRPSSAIEVLFELQRCQRHPRTSKVESTKSSMFEIRKINTGELGGDAATGRVYYVRRADGTLAVRVHRKHDDKEQNRVLQAFDGRIDDLDDALDSQEQRIG